MSKLATYIYRCQGSGCSHESVTHHKWMDPQCDWCGYPMRLISFKEIGTQIFDKIVKDMREINIRKN